MKFCIYDREGCTYEGPIDEGDLQTCENCPYFEEGDEFAGYTDYLESEKRWREK